MNIDLFETQKYLDWLKRVLFLNSQSQNASSRVVRRGQVYVCELGQGIGSEYCKQRPCVIIQNNYNNSSSPTTVIVPITHTFKQLNCYVPISDKFSADNKLILNGYVNVSGIKSIDKARLGNYICDLTPQEMKAIDKSLSIHLGIYKHYSKLQNVISDKNSHIAHLSGLLSNICKEIDVDDYKKILEKIKKLLDKPENI